MESLRQAAAFAIEEETQVATARRAAAAIAARLNLSPDAISRAEVVCVELAKNILHHAGRGHLYLSRTPHADALQIIAADKGPGIGNFERALEDGYSTGTTPGLGLGAVKRMVRALDMYSQRDAGTVLSATVGDPSLHQSAQAAVLSVPIATETLNGDSWVMNLDGPRQVYMVVDGLGHGLYASEASAMAVRLVEKALQDEPAISLTVLLNRIHAPMRATRGAAIALVSVEAGVATCCGVGNISVLLHAPDGSVRNVLSHNGTLGHQMRRVQEFTFALVPGTILVMHSDGIATHWKLSQYPGLTLSAPATIAGVLYRDAVRGRDDATVLVAQLNGEHDA